VSSGAPASRNALGCAARIAPAKRGFVRSWLAQSIDPLFRGQKNASLGVCGMRLSGGFDHAGTARI